MIDRDKEPMVVFKNCLGVQGWTQSHDESSCWQTWGTQGEEQLLIEEDEISSKRLNWWMKFILTIESNQKLHLLTSMNWRLLRSSYLSFGWFVHESMKHLVAFLKVQIERNSFQIQKLFSLILQFLKNSRTSFLEPDKNNILRRSNQP